MKVAALFLEMQKLSPRNFEMKASSKDYSQTSWQLWTVFLVCP